MLAPKPVVSTVAKKNLVIALPYFGQLSLQIRTRINRIMNSHTIISDLFPRISARLVTFLHLKTKFYRSYVLALFKNFSMVAAMLPNMAKLSVILKSECANTGGFLYSLRKELKVMMIPLLKNICYSATTHLILKISQFLKPATMILKSP